MQERTRNIMGQAFEGSDGKWYVKVTRCASCGKDHEKAEIVLRDGSVWFRCGTYGYLIYIREAKKVGQDRA